MASPHTHTSANRLRVKWAGFGRGLATQSYTIYNEMLFRSNAVVVLMLEVRSKAAQRAIHLFPTCASNCPKLCTHFGINCNNTDSKFREDWWPGASAVNGTSPASSPAATRLGSDRDLSFDCPVKIRASCPLEAIYAHHNRYSHLSP